MHYCDAPHIRAWGALSKLPSSVSKVMNALENAGFEAWVVGGYVRDALRGATPHDADVATNAHWQQTREACRAAGMAVHETGIKHGTVTVICDDYPIEVTTFRTEGTYSDHRHPDSVQFVNSIEQDLARRDFTINAMAFHPVRGIVDPFDGQNDLANKVIRCVNSADARFAEDALRVLRAIRFASQLGFCMAPDTELAVRKHAGSLAGVAGERLFQEMDKLLCGPAVRATLLRFAEELAVVVPCIKPMIGFDQHNPWHVYDVFEHTATVVAETPAYPLVRWAALFHDAGKPDTFFIGDDDRGHMPNHQIESVHHMKASAKQLNFSRKLQHDLELLVRFHDDHPEPTEKSVRKLYAKLNNDGRLFHVMCDLMRGDAMGQAEFSHKRTKKIDAVEQLFNEMVERHEPLSMKDLPINGRDLIEYGVPEGPQVGLILNEIFNAVVNGQIPGDRETLLTQIPLRCKNTASLYAKKG